jgi:ubiquinone/menaquinone biosynthesis C-methylase UbiE
VPSEIADAWDRHSAAYQDAARLSTGVAHYGPDIPTEAELRLLGDLKGKKVLELGCGGAQCSIAFAKQGATAIGVDFSPAQLAYARRLCEQEQVRVDLREGDLADLAFLRADSIDLVFSAYAFGYVQDLNRVFRQVHRVLKVGAPLVFSLTHPAYDMIDDVTEPALLVRRSYFDRSPIEFDWAGLTFTAYHHTFSEMYMGLVRASYRIDLVLEPEPDRGGPHSPAWREACNFVPRTLIVRARKEGN